MSLPTNEPVDGEKWYSPDQETSEKSDVARAVQVRNLCDFLNIVTHSTGDRSGCRRVEGERWSERGDFYHDTVVPSPRALFQAVGQARIAVVLEVFVRVVTMQTWGPPNGSRVGVVGSPGLAAGVRNVIGNEDHVTCGAISRVYPRGRRGRATRGRRCTSRLRSCDRRRGGYRRANWKRTLWGTVRRFSAQSAPRCHRTPRRFAVNFIGRTGLGGDLIEKVLPPD